MNVPLANGRSFETDVTGAAASGATKAVTSPAALAGSFGLQAPESISLSLQTLDDQKYQNGMMTPVPLKNIQSFLRDAIHAILMAAKGAIDPARFCAVTSLAEGADRIFAQEALALGCALVCPLPFVQGEYEKDFVAPAALAPASLEQFHAILDRARTGPGLELIEMNGMRAGASAAYAEAGRAVLNRSQLLVGVWDGGAAAGVGGTADTLRQALARHIPVLWLDTRAPGTWALLRDPADMTLFPARPDQHTGLNETVVGMLRSAAAR